MCSVLRTILYTSAELVKTLFSAGLHPRVFAYTDKSPIPSHADALRKEIGRGGNVLDTANMKRNDELYAHTGRRRANGSA